jgi:hypothetical protein
MTKLKSLTLLGHGFAQSVPAFGQIPSLKSQTPKLKEANSKLQVPDFRSQGSPRLQFRKPKPKATNRRRRLLDDKHGGA